MPTQNGRLAQPADGDAANAQSVNTVFQQLREALSDVSLRNAHMVRLAGTINEARAVLGLGAGTAWIVGGASGDVAISHNGQEWTEIADSTSETIFAFAQYGANVIAVGAAGMFGRSTNVSTHAPTWSYTTPDASFSSNFFDVAVGTTHVVAVGSAGEIQRAAVGTLTTLTHIAADASYAGNFVAVVYDAGNTRFIAFGDDGEIQVSNNEGLTWLSLGAVGAGWADAATNGAGSIRAVTDGGDVWASDDGGMTWNQFPSSTAGDYKAIVFNGVLFVALQSASDASAVLWFNEDAEDINAQNVQYLSEAMRGFALGIQPLSEGMATAGLLAAGSEAGSDFVIARFLGGRI